MASADNIPSASRQLLQLLGPTDRQPASLSLEQWHEADRLAREHRLRPHLHARRTRGELAYDVPTSIAETWQGSHRGSGMAALVQRRELQALAAVLESKRIRLIALKGSWLAWHAYPAPAERPLRDLDIFVDPKDAPEALHALLDHDLTPSEPLPGNPREFAIENKQFPPLMTASGLWVELHSHLWEPPGSMEWQTPPVRDEELSARALAAEDIAGLHYLDPTDMLAHLAIHAAYSHRFEVGPLLLADVDYLVGTKKIEWSRLWQDALAGSYERGLALVLAVVERWRRPGLLEESTCPLDLPDDTVADASALLCQPLAARQSTRSLAAWQSARERGGLTSALTTIAGRAARLAGNPARLTQRIGESFSSLGNSAISDSAKRSASIGRWLES